MSVARETIAIRNSLFWDIRRCPCFSGNRDVHGDTSALHMRPYHVLLCLCQNRKSDECGSTAQNISSLLSSALSTHLHLRLAPAAITSPALTTRVLPMPCRPQAASLFEIPNWCRKRDSEGSVMAGTVLHLHTSSPPHATNYC